MTGLLFVMRVSSLWDISAYCTSEKVRMQQEIHGKRWAALAKRLFLVYTDKK